jgi:hypothetical protein
MTIKELLAKAARGETLTPEERDALAKYDPDAAAAAARKKSESEAEEARKAAEKAAADLKALQEQIENGKRAQQTDVQRLQETLKAVQAQLETQQREATALKEQNAKSARSARIQQIAQTAGIRFVPGVDGRIMARAFEDSLATLKDSELEDAASFTPHVEAFRGANKAVLADTTGSGSGGAAHDGTSHGTKTTISGQGLIDLASRGDIAAAEKAIGEASAASRAGTLKLT